MIQSNHSRVVHENPYVELLGRIQWSDHYQCHTALAQVEGMLCIVEVRMNEHPLPEKDSD